MKRLALCIAILSSTFVMAEDVKITIHVEDMTCALCVTSINQSLRKTEGVIKAKASMKTNNVEVIAPKEMDTQILLNAIADTGYTGEVINIEDIQ